jgi:hypothetical protein
MPSTFFASQIVRIFIAVVVTLIGAKGYAQVDNEAFETVIQLDSSQNLGFELPMTGFVKNNEFFNELREGYTLWGMQLSPALVYRVSGKVLLRGGVFWRNDFGEDQLNQPQLTFTL